MKYMGSKNRIAKHILPIMLAEAKKNNITTWVEPMVGGGNMIDKVPNTFKRVGADYNRYLIDFFVSIQHGWTPPEHVSADQYQSIKSNKENDTKLTFWAGIGCSYCGKWFGGYANDYPENRRNKNGALPNFQKEVRNGLMKQLPKIKEVDFIFSSYENLIFTEKSLIYCDPPYDGTTKYKDDFNHSKFWEWCRGKVSEGHIVFVSEYNAPDDFQCVKEIHTNTQLGNGSNSGNQVKTEKLFVYNQFHGLDF